MALIILICAAVAGGALYYTQEYAFYETVTPKGADDVQMLSVVSLNPETIVYDNFQAIDANSSPIRYRACFTTSFSLAMLSETYVGVVHATPRNAPDWFDCFDAEEIGVELEEGTALAFMGQKNIAYGVDRIIAITDDGRGYVWHDLNECGDKAYDGTAIGEACPPRPSDATSN